MKIEEQRQEELEAEILADAGKDMARDYELLTYDDFFDIWGFK